MRVIRWRPMSFFLVRILVFVLHRQRSFSSSVDFDVEFSLREEKPVRTSVGCVADFLTSSRRRETSGSSVRNHTYDVITHRSRWRFRFLTTASEADGGGVTGNDDVMFTIDELSGEIRTACRIDRDVICRKSITCLVRLDVVVTGRWKATSAVDIVRVGVKIDDENDNAPVFPVDIVTRCVSRTQELPFVVDRTFLMSFCV